MRGGSMGNGMSLGGMPRTFGMQRGGPPDDRAAAATLDRAHLSRVAHYLAPYWRNWLVIFACVGLSAGLGVLPPLCVRSILDGAIPQRDLRQLYALVAAIVALNLTAGLIGVLQTYANAHVGQKILFDLRRDLFARLQRMSLPFYTATRAGEIVSRVNNDVGAVQHVATGTLVEIVRNVLTVAATASVIFALNWRLAVLSILAVPLMIVPTRLVGRVRRRLSKQTQERQADLLAFLQERLNIGGMLLTKIFGQAAADAAAFERRNRAVQELNVRQALAGRWLFMCLGVVSVAGPALIYAYGGALAVRGMLSTGTIIAFVAYLTSLYRPLAQLANVYVDVQGALAVFERIFQYVDLTPEVVDHPGAPALSAIRGHVRFEHVSFRYPTAPSAADAEPPAAKPATPFALEDVSFEMRPGERVALVGPSGAGKTTITYLLPRFLDPDRGAITLDGHDLRHVKQESVRAQIGMVTQETFLFHATVRENLLYARPDASPDELYAAARAAQIHETLAGLPQGYDTVVGERAFRLSGGERQRVSIARALLKDPRILVLDEATSSLDATSEHLIQQALEALLRGRTSLIVAHRLSTVLGADRIVVLDRGHIVESGRHAELLAMNGLYAKLYQQQFARVIADHRQT